MTSAWIPKFVLIIAAAVLFTAAVGFADGLQAASLKKSFGQLRYYGGPKSPMWRG